MITSLLLVAALLPQSPVETTTPSLIGKWDGYVMENANNPKTMRRRPSFRLLLDVRDDFTFVMTSQPDGKRMEGSWQQFRNELHLIAETEQGKVVPRSEEVLFLSKDGILRSKQAASRGIFTRQRA